MLTEKANVLHEKITALPAHETAKSKKLARRLMKELVENCKPTREEFDRVTGRMLVSGETLWDMIPAILEWRNE